MLYKHILTAKIMIIKNLKIQMLAGNSLKMYVGAGFEISLTLKTQWEISLIVKCNGVLYFTYEICHCASDNV